MTKGMSEVQLGARRQRVLADRSGHLCIFNLTPLIGRNVLNILYINNTLFKQKVCYLDNIKLSL